MITIWLQASWVHLQPGQYASLPYTNPCEIECDQYGCKPFLITVFHEVLSLCTSDFVMLNKKPFTLIHIIYGIWSFDPLVLPIYKPFYERMLDPYILPWTIPFV